MFFMEVTLVCTPKYVKYFLQVLIKVLNVCLMTQIGTKFRYVFKLHRSDLKTKINHCIQHILLYRILQKFDSIHVYSFLLKCPASTRNIDMF